MPSILVICTANQCRSPIAEALLRQHLTETYPNRSWRIESAGTWAQNEKPAQPKMQRSAQEVGLDLSQHRARNIDVVTDLSSFDLILTMEQGQKEAVCIEFPEVASRTYLLTELLGFPFDVPDPIGKTSQHYRDTVREIRNFINDATERIVELASTEKAHSG